MSHSKNFKTNSQPPFNLFSEIFVNIILLLINFYRLFLSALLGVGCRFTPSCSSYSYEAFKIFGLRIGFIKTVKRLAKCHPWGGHGFDPVINFELTGKNESCGSNHEFTARKQA